MENLDKIISLNQASKISGYNPDYLSALIRKKDIKGEKIGGSWFTTEKEIEKYIFSQKIRNKKWIVKCFLYLYKKIFNRNFIYAFICLVLFSTVLYFYNDYYIKAQIQKTNTKPSEINKIKIEEGLKF